MSAVSSSPRRRLALFSPLPPQRSGIATYTGRLTAELRHHCEITVFVGADPTEVEAPPGVGVENVARFFAAEAERRFDASLFFIGNSHYHVSMLEVLKQHRGAVLFHDVRLTGLYQQLHHYTPHLLTDGSVGATVRHFYPGLYCTEIEQMAVISPEVADEHGVYLAREAALSADQVFVHSLHAAELLRQDAGVEASIPYSLPCPAMAQAASAAPAKHDADRPVLGAFGMVAPIKQPELLIETLSLVRHQLPLARLRFVGAVDEPYQAELSALADRHGVGDGVEFTGHLPDDEFTAAQREATVALQLRAASNGESSACVTELLALGVPTIVSAMGAMNELPDSVVAKVDETAGPDHMAKLVHDMITGAEVRNELHQTARRFALDNSFSTAAAALADQLFG